ncbi:MAG: hypothetical protein ACFFDH_10705 [Promethearchaeota archaeon]
MDDIQDSKNEIVDILKKINKRLDRIHNWVAAYIFLSLSFSLLLIPFFIFTVG